MLNFETIQSVVFDMDGVLWRGNQPLPGIPSIFEFLQTRSIPYAFATNNSSRTPQMYVEKLDALGITAEPEQIVTSAVATSVYCRAQFSEARRVYVVGGPGLHEALEEQEFELVDEAQAELVVVGIDRGLTYDILRRACFQIQGGATFIGTNPDKSFPEPNGLAPGAGSILAAIEAATGVSPTIVGKPYAPMFKAAARILGTPAAHTLMIGDRLETDIQGAAQAGLKSILVLSGVSSEADVEESGVNPDAVFSDLSAVLEVWRA